MTEKATDVSMRLDIKPQVAWVICIMPQSTVHSINPSDEKQLIYNKISLSKTDITKQLQGKI